MRFYLTFSVLCGLIRFGLSQNEDIPNGASSLAFVFDITGSMYDDLVQVIEGAKKIMAVTLARRVNPLYNYILVPFHDPDIGPVIVTTDPDEFVDELRDLYVHGGGDCPEMSIGAIREALEIALPNSYIYVFTDARAKDYVLTEDVLALIQHKQSQVVFVLTGDCGNHTHGGFQSYEKIASTSSGQVFLLKKDQVNQVLEFVKLTVQAQKVNLMSIDNPGHSVNTYFIPVDNKLEEFTVSVSGKQPDIKLWSPGQEEEFTEYDGLRKLLDLKKVQIKNVRDPEPGKWKLQVSSNSSHTVRVHGLSSANFVSGFSRKPASHISSTTLRPLAGVDSHTLVNTSDMDPPTELFKLKLLDLRGQVLAEYPLEKHSLKDQVYRVKPFTPPNTFFYIQITGIDTDGNALQRLTPTAISVREATRPTVYMTDVTRGYYESTAFITCEVISEIPFTVQWSRTGKSQGNEHGYSDSANVTLEVPSATERSEGLYMCNATNKAGWRATQTYLDVSEPPPSIIPPSNVSALPAEQAMLTCFVYSTVEHNITWYKVGRNSQIKSNRKFQILSNGSLIIRDIKVEDDGKYVCRVGNEGGFTKKSVFLTVQVPPEVQITPNKQEFQKGRKISFNCLGTGYPEPTYYWMRDGALLIPTERVKIRSGLLIIRDLVRNDEGSYQCLARNPAGESVAIAQLVYIENPEITLYEPEIMVAAGDPAILKCSTNGIPPPLITWYKGDVQIRALSYVKISDDGQLTILGTQAQDAGKYRCVASNNAGSTSATTQLTIGSDPKLVSPPQNTGADIGTNSTLTCRASGLPTPDIQWLAKGQPVVSGGRFRQLPGGELFIQGIIPEDEGQYTCVAKNRFGVTEHNAYLTVTGMLRPVITYTVPFVEVIAGKEISLDCNLVQGNPKPRVRWLRNGKPITNSSLTDTAETLTLSNVQKEDAGDYTCVASNVVGNATSVVSVSVQTPPSFSTSEPEDQLTNFTVNQGDGVVIPCSVEGDPRPQIRWFKDESPISNTDLHYFIRQDSSLEIFSSDSEDTGSYKCQASNIAGSIDKTVSLFVRVPPAIDGDLMEDLSTKSGDTINLKCIASGVPKPEVVWTKNSKPFSPKLDRFIINEFGLTILKVQESDKAVYKCIVKNIAGETTKIMTVNVQTPPKIEEDDTSNTNVTVTKGGSTTLTCDVKGDPLPTITWTKDGIILDTDSFKYEMLETGSLLVHDVSEQDGGEYVCEAENDAGSDSKDFILSVKVPPELTENLPSRTEVVENEPVSLVCPVTGSPPPTVVWYKDGNQIDDSDEGYSLSTDGTLIVMNVDVNDEGLYKCVATNDVGSVAREVTVDVHVRPKVTNVDSGPDSLQRPTVLLNNSMTLTCPIDADPLPKFTWYKDGRQINKGDYSLSSNGKTLTISGARVTDAGQFTCEAENVAGKTNVTFDVDVHVPPHIDRTAVSPDHMTVIKKKPLVINCPISGIPTPNITWFKDGQVVEQSNHVTISLKGRQLTIRNTTIVDLGQYKCKGESSAGTEEKSFNVKVLVPPRVQKPRVIDQPEVIEGKTLRLTCPAKGFPLPNITWYINNQPIRDDTDRISLVDNGWTLELLNVSSEDSGRYICRAENEAGSSEKAFDLNILLASKIPKNKLDLSPELILGRGMTLACPAVGNPVPSITWYKDDQPIDFSLPSPYKTTSQGRQLHILSARESAVFRCHASNIAGDDEIEFDLQVLLPARVNRTGINTYPKVHSGDPLTLLCPAEGIPPPHISWYKDGLALNVTEPQLMIDGVDVEDAGSYKCVVENEAGKSELIFDVKVQDPPEIPKDSIVTNPKIIQGKAHTLTCPATGTPPPTITWYRNGQFMDLLLDPNIELRSNGRQLHIKSVDIQNQGQYTCSASNEAGVTDLNFDLEVLVPPTIDDSFGTDITSVENGHSTTLYCPVSGNPTPTIQWYKDGRALSPSDRLRMEDDGQKLTLIKARVQDAGNYTCVAKNVAGETSQEFPVQVLVPPSIDESNVIYNRKVNVNRTVLIDCPVEGIPLPDVTWFVNSLPLQESERHILLHNNRHLKIIHVQVEDSGIYTCQAINEAGSLNKNFKLTVQIPAKIDLTNLRNQFYVVQNRTVYIDCPVTGTPQPSVMWLKDTIPLLDFPYKDLRVLNQGQRLEVSNAQVEDAGRYTCDVSNIAGSDKQHFELEVRVPPKVDGLRTTTKSSVVVGRPINLECLVQGVPKPDITWLKDNKPVDIDDTPHITVMAEGQVLQFISGRSDDNGRYTCRANNSAGVAEKYYDLSVNVPPKVNGSDEVQREFVTLNQQHVLDCPASGIPPPTITWSFKGEVIPEYGSPSHRILDRGRQLLLINTQLFDAGMYTCTVSNVAGNTSLDFQVEVQMPPTIAEGPRQVAGEVNRRVRLQCESEGLPKPRVTWLKNGEPFPVTGLRHTILDKGSLEFVSVQLEDSGDYTCHVSNPAGNVTKNVRLDVQVRPKMKHQRPVEIYVVHKESADIPCEVEAYPPPRIIWQFGASILAEHPQNPDNQRFSNSNFQIVDNSTLRIKNVSDSDAGTYVCIARNNAGTAIGHNRVIVTVPPKILSSRTEFIVSHGNDIVLPCNWEGNPLPKITWTKDGVPITYADFHYRILDSGALVIPYSRPVDAGTYTCQVENKYGKDSVNIDLLVEVPPTITRDASLLTSSVGDTLNMPCEAYGIPEPVIQWYKDSRQINNDSLRHNIDINGTLTILKLQAGDTGSYTCIARNVAGRDHYDRILRVQVPPSIIQSPLNTEVVTNGRFMLKCRATGIPVPNIYWRRNGKPYRTRPSYRGRSRLIVRNVIQQDAGVYTCIARNPAGTVKASATISLKVPPEVSVQNTDVVAYQNENMMLPCSVTGSPLPDIYWTKNGRPLKLNDRIVQLNNGSLMIYKSKRFDSGDYTCVAVNEAGSSKGMVTLSVHGRPTITVEPKHTSVMEGDIAVLNCVAEGEPYFYTSWLKGTNKISASDRFSILPNNSLRIIATRLSDSETYSCLVANALGFDTSAANLTVVVHGRFSLWSDWGPCSSSCGTGKQMRYRDCSNPPPANGGRGCVGSTEESRSCSVMQCPVDGSWSPWGTYSVCSATCSGGKKVRFRTCTDPPPQSGGKDCIGPNEEQIPCNTDPCPVPGDWNSWGSWSECSTSCNEGYKERYRVCNTPLIGGLPCVGNRVQRTRCTVKPCYKVPTRAEGNLVGYINNMDITDGKIKAEASPSPDGTVINATLDNLPPEVSVHLQHLISVLNPVYWSLSQEVDGASNGYRLTDGNYNRETQVQFATGEILKMNQHVTGVDRDGVLHYNVILTGNVPTLPQNSDIQLYPYTEDYIQTSPNTLYSHSSRLMRVNGHMLPYAWNHTVSYDQSHGVMPFLVEKLTTKNIHAARDSSGKKVQFSVVSQISRGSNGGQCPDGFILNRQESYCTDEDECITNQPCSHYCHNSPGSYSCSCNPGFSLDRSGQICQDVDECANNNGGCGADNQCINIDGSFICAVICKEGYRTAEDGNRCVDVDECRETPEVCGQICQNIPGSYQCSCRAGFQLRNDNSGRCTDVNECNTGQSTCSHICKNTIGSYRCACPSGMRLYRKYSCEDIDECREGRHNCRPGQECINTRGSYQCRIRCHSGYQQQRDGSCTDVNECLTNHHRCYSNQRCVNTEGSYYCQCQPGYRSRGPGQPCLDVNECQEDEGICQHNCTNIVGSFRCTCPLGYRVARDGRKCVDINECLEQNIQCGEERMCFNQRGDFSCIETPCPRNYRRDPLTNYCVLECVDSSIPCPPHAKYADVIEFRTLALPSGYLTYQDLIRLSAYDHLNVKLFSNFTILENDPKIDFHLRPVDGSGIVYTLQPLVEKTTYKIKVSARSLETRRNSLRYQTTFIIHISVSAYPY